MYVCKWWFKWVSIINSVFCKLWMHLSKLFLSINSIYIYQYHLFTQKSHSSSLSEYGNFVSARAISDVVIKPCTSSSFKWTNKWIWPFYIRFISGNLNNHLKHTRKYLKYTLKPRWLKPNRSLFHQYVQSTIKQSQRISFTKSIDFLKIMTKKHRYWLQIKFTSTNAIP